MPPTYRFRLLRCGDFRLDGGGMFGLIPKSLWRVAVEPDADNRIPLTTNALLVERDGDGAGDGRPNRILIECGYGDKWTDKERAIYELERRTAVDALRAVVDRIRGTDARLEDAFDRIAADADRHFQDG